MELLVVTLAHALQSRDTDGLARIRLISDTLRNAPGLMTARAYRSGEQIPSYLLLTSWENKEFWQRAQERYNPRQLLLESPGGLLAAPPEQWLMHYLWGYTRPAAPQSVAAAHLATIRFDAVERIRRAWIESLQKLVVEPMLAFAFLTQNITEDSPFAQVPQQHSFFLNLLSWPGEAYCEEFYADQNYKAINSYLSVTGMVRVMPLEPL